MYKWYTYILQLICSTIHPRLSKGEICPQNVQTLGPTIPSLRGAHATSSSRSPFGIPLPLSIQTSHLDCPLWSTHRCIIISHLSVSRGCCVFLGLAEEPDPLLRPLRLEAPQQQRAAALLQVQARVENPAKYREPSISARNACSSR